MALDDSTHQPQDWKEERRRRALELKASGWPQKLIAEAFGVSEAAVSKWVRRARHLGATAWQAQPRGGARPKLPPNQLNLLPDLLSHGAEAYGFRGEVWTCAHLASVIAAEFAVTYHPAHVSRLLKQLDWTPQLPITRAAQRDEVCIAHWRATIWPQLQIAARQAGQTIVFIDEAAFYLLPGMVKSYAPRGQPSVLTVVQSYDHLSVMSAITPAGGLYTLVRDQALTSHESVSFLNHLRRHLLTPLLVIWDGAPIHRTGEVPAYVAAVGQRAIHLEPLPPYAPDLNPDEGVWNHLKQVEMANLACHDLAELRDELDLAISRLRQRPALLQSFFAAAGLSLSS